MCGFKPVPMPAYRPLLHLDFFEKAAPTQAAYRQRHRYYWDEILHYCDYFSNEELSVLEVGCGTGELIGRIRGRRRVGIDYSPAMIEQARRQFPQVQFEVMNAHELPPAERFDLILISNVVGYLDDVQHAFGQLHQVCHARTKIIVTTCNFVWEPPLRWAERLGWKRPTPRQNWLSRHDIRNLLYLAGFETYRESLRMLLPVRVPLLSGLLNRYVARLPLIRHLCINQYAFARPDPSHQLRQEYSVSIIIPARNESGNLENALLRMPRFGREQEIIFVEGNSTDDTWTRMQEIYEQYRHLFTLRVLQQDGKGKGNAVRNGFAAATGEVLMILDADLTVPPEDLPKFYQALASGQGDFINGSRLVYAMEKHAMRPLNLLGNKFFSLLFSWLLDQPFKDTLCGTKVIFRKDYERLVANRRFFGDFDPFGDFDLLFGAFKLNLKMVEVPIRYRERTYGQTNISRFSHGWLLLRMCAFAARKLKFI